MPVPLIIIVLILYASLGTYVFLRGRQVLPKIRMLYILYQAVFIFASLCFIAGIVLAKTLPMSLSIICKNTGGCWAFSLALFAIAAFFADLLSMLKRFSPALRTCLEIHGTKISRWYFSLVFLVVLSIILHGYFRFVHPQIVTLNLNIDKDTPPHEKYTLIAASDLHLGGVCGIKRLDTWVNLINRQQPDVIVLAGDLLDHDFEYQDAGSYIRELQKLKARYGVYAIFGNHEHYQDPKQASAFIKLSGIQLLCDQAITLDSSIVLIGRDDGTNTHRKLLETVMTGLNRNLPLILFDHQPTLGEGELNKVDLQVSGHLHNGQIYPYNLFLAHLWPLTYGYKKSGDTRCYVTSGLGLRFIPLRLGTQSEIAIFHLDTKRQHGQNKD